MSFFVTEQEDENARRDAKANRVDIINNSLIDNPLLRRLLGEQLNDLKPSDSSAMSGGSKSPTSPPNNEKGVI